MIFSSLLGEISVFGRLVSSSFFGVSATGGTIFSSFTTGAGSSLLGVSTTGGTVTGGISS
ncbi:hypothetical protein D3C86_1427350 [compost metagenome]